MSTPNVPRSAERARNRFGRSPAGPKSWAWLWQAMHPEDRHGPPAVERGQVFRPGQAAARGRGSRGWSECPASSVISRSGRRRGNDLHLAPRPARAAESYSHADETWRGHIRHRVRTAWP